MGYSTVAPIIDTYKAIQQSAMKALLCPGPAQARPWLPNKSETKFGLSTCACTEAETCAPHVNSYYSLTP